MAKRYLLFTAVLLLCLSAVMAKTEYMKYKDPKLAVNVRIKDLMKRMTLAEKIGQMVQIDRTVASNKVMKKYLIGKKLLNSLVFLFCYVLLWFVHYLS